MKNVTDDLLHITGEVQSEMSKNNMNTNIIIEHFRSFSEHATMRKGEAYEL